MLPVCIDSIVYSLEFAEEGAFFGGSKQYYLSLEKFSAKVGKFLGGPNSITIDLSLDPIVIDIVYFVDLDFAEWGPNSITCP